MKTRGAFSLLELLCTVAILLILTVIMTTHGQASAAKKKRVGCEANLEKISLALNLYQNDNHGAYPSLTTASNSESVLSMLVPQDTAETAIFICPGSDDKELAEGQGFNGETISYAYYMGRGSNDDPGSVIITDRQVNDSSKTAGQPIFSATGKPPGNNHGKTGGNLLLLNGTVQFSLPSAERDLLLNGRLRLLNP